MAGPPPASAASPATARKYAAWRTFPGRPPARGLPAGGVPSRRQAGPAGALLRAGCRARPAAGPGQVDAGMTAGPGWRTLPALTGCAELSVDAAGPEIGRAHV